jgi:hypothetical protein
MNGYAGAFPRCGRNPHGAATLSTTDDHEQFWCDELRRQQASGQNVLEFCQTAGLTTLNRGHSDNPKNGQVWVHLGDYEYAYAVYDMNCQSGAGMGRGRSSTGATAVYRQAASAATPGCARRESPKSPAGSSRHYSTNQWAALEVYVTDGDLRSTTTPRNGR